MNMPLPTENELIAWATTTVARDIQSIMPKIVEYGAIDLELMGKALLEFAPQGAGRGENWANISVGMEYAVIFYLQGKIARCVSTIAVGKLPSDDTIMDITIYSLMLRRIREFGSWGVAPLPTDEPDHHGADHLWEEECLSTEDTHQSQDQSIPGL